MEVKTEDAYKIVARVDDLDESASEKPSVGKHLGSLWPIIIAGSLFNIFLTAAAYTFPSHFCLVLAVTFGASLKFLRLASPLLLPDAFFRESW